MINKFLSSAIDTIGNSAFARQTATDAAIGAASAVGITAATGLAGLAGSITGFTNSDLSMSKLIGSAVKGGIGGAALGSALRSNSNFGSGVRSVFKGAGSMMGPERANAFSSAVVSATQQANAPMRNVAHSISRSFVKGSRTPYSSGNQTIRQQATQVYNNFSKMNRMSQAGAAAAVSGLAYGAYTSNSLGMAIPGNYGYR